MHCRGSTARICSMFEHGPAFAAALDAADPLAGFRDRVPSSERAEDGSPITYFVGNSLGFYSPGGPQRKL